MGKSNSKVLNSFNHCFKIFMHLLFYFRNGIRIALHKNCSRIDEDLFIFELFFQSISSKK